MLVATGSLYRVQPQRVVCKRIVLSGHPYKINKRSAVIRYMFFNRGEWVRVCVGGCVGWVGVSMTLVVCVSRGHLVVQASRAEDQVWLPGPHQGIPRLLSVIMHACVLELLYVCRHAWSHEVCV